MVIDSDKVDFLNRKEDLGKIEVLDVSAFVAVKRKKINQTLSLIKDEKIKNKKIKIEIAL